MQIEFITNSCVLIRLNSDKTILVDPWFFPAYHGSWYNFPPLSDDGRQKYLSFRPDYIHISHLHPDHLDSTTLSYFHTETPIIIGELPYSHLERRLRSLGFQNILKFTLDLPISFLNTQIMICKDYHAMQSQPEDQVAYSMDTSFWLKDDDGTTIFHVNDNVITPHAAEKLVQSYGSPTVAIIPYSGASMYPHAFPDYTHEQKLEKKDELRTRSLKSLFLDIAEILSPLYVIPAAGSYVMGGSLTEYNTYLHQATPHQLKDFWSEYSTVDSKLFFMHEGDVLDTIQSNVKCNPNALFRDFTELDRYQYGKTLSNLKLEHEKIAIPNSFEIPWSRLLNKCRCNLWFRQQNLSIFPQADVVLNLLDGNNKIFTFSFALDAECSQSNSIWNDQSSTTLDNRYKIIFEIDWRLMMMVMIGATIWNNLEIAALLTVRRQPDNYNPTIHSLMSYFTL